MVDGMGLPLRERPFSSAMWFGDPCQKVSCPYDPNHQMPTSSLEKHIVSCRLKKLEYSKEEESEMYDSTFFYEKAKIPKVQMDKNLQFDIIKQATAKECGSYYPGAYSSLPVEVPQNHKRYICDLTQADRLAIYDYVLAETKNQRSRSQLTENDSDLFVDLAAKINQGLEKNVIRDVIGVHMEELATHWQEENRNSDICDDETSSISVKSSGRKEEQRSGSTDSRQSCGSSRDVDRSKHRSPEMKTSIIVTKKENKICTIVWKCRIRKLSVSFQ
ncbi:hypothetical protein JD844_016925 [Phrynosoma platyrhinos]|uniref:CHHC U11-48K-type domain-containing protein n=1 Tax=Phrynosoma platyrhinos TaxID=52577 RepID=A0ABQ7SKX8_PHRPL|nr:hypothetical protein JD844_016925 [Phrynosoma platyrhinos]